MIETSLNPDGDWFFAPPPIGIDPFPKNSWAAMWAVLGNNLSIRRPVGTTSDGLVRIEHYILFSEFEDGRAVCLVYRYSVDPQNPEEPIGKLAPTEFQVSKTREEWLRLAECTRFEIPVYRTGQIYRNKKTGGYTRILAKVGNKITYQAVGWDTESYEGYFLPNAHTPEYPYGWELAQDATDMPCSKLCS